jgi:hypothetical protein
MATTEHLTLERERHFNSRINARTISISAALAVDVGLVWLL